MSEFTLPENSKVGEGKHWALPRPAERVVGRLVANPARRLGLQIPLFRAPAACW